MSAVYHDEGRYPRYETIVAGPDQTRHHMLIAGSRGGCLRDLHVRDCARAAADDYIYFVGLEVTIFAPCGLGRGVYDALLSAGAKAQA